MLIQSLLESKDRLWKTLAICTALKYSWMSGTPIPPLVCGSLRVLCEIRCRLFFQINLFSKVCHLCRSTLGISIGSMRVRKRNFDVINDLTMCILLIQEKLCHVRLARDCVSVLRKLVKFALYKLAIFTGMTTSKYFHDDEIQ